MEKSKVYFMKEITEENVLKMYKVLGRELKGKVAVKVHSGEAGNKNFLRPLFMKDVIDYVNGTVVECNTAYAGERDTTEKHKKLMEAHEWSKYFDVDIMDGEGEITLSIPNGKMIKENYVGKNILNYDSMLVISHFKGHQMGGFGGALKQISIGCASSFGKAYIHGAGDASKLWTQKQDKFILSMADAASSVVELFNGNILYINVMCNMSVDCDCNGNASPPCMADIGILSSTDPVALDKACVDLIYNSTDPGKDAIIKRIESKNGTLLIDASHELGIGNCEYELIRVEE